MKTAHTASAAASHATAAHQTPRRPGMGGPAHSPADSFAQLLSGLGDAPAEVAPIDPTVTDGATAATGSASPDPSAALPPADSQAVALLLGLPNAPALLPPGLQGTGSEPQASGAPTLATGDGAAAAASPWSWNDKLLPAQASPVAALATGRPLSATDPGKGQASQPLAGSDQTTMPLTTAPMGGAQPGPLTGENPAAEPPLDSTAITDQEGGEIHAALMPRAAAPGEPAAPATTALQAGANGEPAALRTRTAPGRLVSAAARLSTTAGSPAQSLERLARDGEAATRSWHMLQPGQPGSGLALEAQAGQTQALTGTSAPVAGMDARDPGRPGDGSGHGQGATGLPGSEGTATAATEGSEGAAPPAGFARSLDQALQSLGAQVSVWSAQKLQHASMDLDTGRGPSLQVDVTLDEGKVELQFRSDDATVREAIRAHAQSALTDLLSRQGMDLTGLSVSTQGSGRGAGQEGGSPQSGQGRRGAPAMERLASLASEPPARVLRSDRALDMYA
jgi:flagellar hook-length control protein FliK